MTNVIGRWRKPARLIDALQAFVAETRQTQQQFLASSQFHQTQAMAMTPESVS